jgi:hypothetical protein
MTYAVFMVLSSSSISIATAASTPLRAPGFLEFCLGHALDNSLQLSFFLPSQFSEAPASLDASEEVFQAGELRSLSRIELVDAQLVQPAVPALQNFIVERHDCGNIERGAAIASNMALPFGAG